MEAREVSGAPSGPLDLVAHVLRENPTPIHAPDVAAWWRVFVSRRPAGAPIDHAILAGAWADRVGFAVAGAQQAALRALVPSLPEAAIASFCATESGGNAPRAIESRLIPAPDGGYILGGTKRWSTMAPLAAVLLVVASEGVDSAGRKRLRLARIDADARGVHIEPMPVTSFTPELPHATIEFDAVAVAGDALLPGDAYILHVKPFRTIEDVYIHAALLGYVLSVARRYRFPDDAVERLIISLVATRALAACAPSAPEVHIALAGLLTQDARLLENLASAWTGVPLAERSRWDRDRPLFAVAGPIRERRRQRAWALLNSQGE